METIKKIGKVTSQSVLKCTGKNWDQWVKILNDQGAKTWPHKEIAKFLKTKHKLGPWWQQGVTSAYEIHIGRRIEGQNQKGKYSTVATKTYTQSAKALWDFLISPSGIKTWLNPLSDFEIKIGSQYEVYGGIFGQIRTMKPVGAVRRIRMTWQETDWPKPTTVQIGVYVRPGKKTMIAIQHDSLPDENYKAKMLKRWKEALEGVGERI